MILDKRPLTPIQRKIVALMREHGRTTFYLNERHFGWRKHPDSYLAIFADQRSKASLQARGLIERDEAEGFPVYTLTPAGQERADRIKEMPR